MDAKAKRDMWNTLKDISPGRSIVLTTHSMEESEYLSKRAGIISRKMLALGSTNHLRKRFGNDYHIQIVLASAPNTTQEEMENVKVWLLKHFEGAELEDKSLHGQIKFKVPATKTVYHSSSAITGDQISSHQDADVVRKSISSLFTKLEDNKVNLGILYYSISRTTLEEVFLNIVGKSEAIEEGYEKEEEAMQAEKKRFKTRTKNI